MFATISRPHRVALKLFGAFDQADQTQMEMLGRLQTASAAAKTIIATSCTKETVSTGPNHFAEMQKRLTGLLESIKIVRQPYEAFYSSLDTRQKALLDALGPTRRGWAW